MANVQYLRARLISISAIVMFLLLYATRVQACNSMANGSLGKLSAAVVIGIFLPMALLIPFELKILRDVGNLGSLAVRAYIFCLPAKIVPMAFAFYGATYLSDKGVWGFITGELIYSVTHFVIATGILSVAFKFDTKKRAILTAALTSTIIPWAYSVGMPLTIISTAIFLDVIGA